MTQEEFMKKSHELWDRIMPATGWGVRNVSETQKAEMLRETWKMFQAEKGGVDFDDERFINALLDTRHIQSVQVRAAAIKKLLT